MIILIEVVEIIVLLTIGYFIGKWRTQKKLGVK